MCCWVILHNLLNVWFDWTPIGKCPFCQCFVHPGTHCKVRWCNVADEGAPLGEYLHICVFAYLCICIFVYLWFCIWYEHLDARMEGESVPSRLMICSLASLPGDTFTRDFSSRLFLSTRGHCSSQHRQDANLRVFNKLQKTLVWISPLPETSWQGFVTFLQQPTKIYDSNLWFF